MLMSVCVCARASCQTKSSPEKVCLNSLRLFFALQLLSVRLYQAVSLKVNQNLCSENAKRVLVQRLKRKASRCSCVSADRRVLARDYTLIFTLIYQVLLILNKTISR